MALRMPTLMQPRCTDCSTTRGPAAGPTAPAGGFSSGTGYRTYSACTVCILDMVPTTQSVIRSLLVMDCSPRFKMRHHTGTGESCKSHRTGAHGGVAAERPSGGPVCCARCDVLGTHHATDPVSDPVSGNLQWEPGHLDTWEPRSQGTETAFRTRRRKTLRVCCRGMLRCDYTIPCTLLVGPGSLARCMPQTKPGESARSIRSSVFCPLR